MEARSGEQRVYYEEDQGADAGVDDVLEGADSFHDCERIGDGGIGEGEVALERYDEELALRIASV